MGVPSTKRFSVRRRIGEGGMGVVYEAFDEERRALVALKSLNRFDGPALARFKREFRALQGLVHTNLVALDELFFENDQWFFTMELLAGADFISYVRGAPPSVFESTVRASNGKISVRPPTSEAPPAAGTFNEQKLRDSLRQLLDGLSVLHAADKVHRDVKPSNVLVTDEGRVVLLDFGLVTDSSAEDRSTGSAVVGTPAYMSPEQAASREVGPASDLYAVGAMLFEALTGQLPITGPQLQVLIEKQTKEPPRASTLVPNVPSDLDVLCARLLRFDPTQRPSAADCQRILAARIPLVTMSDLRPNSLDAPTFVGREPELAELQRAHEESEKGQLATVLVCGESGIGKSYTVRRFTAQLVADRPQTMLLEGRCYERETVPYKTLDGVVNALASKLAKLPSAEVTALLPARSAVLAHVFPAMLRVAQVAREHAKSALNVEPHEFRQRAFVALRDLLTRVAVRRPVVLVIDDLQWADDDGLRALAEILRPPDAPPILLIGTVRLTPGAPSSPLAKLRATMPGETRTIELSSLGHDDARALAAALLRRAEIPEADAERIASEAGGHPLFVEELARHVTLGDVASGEVKLDDAIWSRVVLLDPKTRELAELVAVAGKPVPQEVVAAAARVEPGEFNRRAASLRVSHLVRTGGARWADAIEPYHDRVREAVLAQLEPARRRAHHESLAIAFEASTHADPETLAAHWREAGSAARAVMYAVAAGDQAEKTFAFDRAAQWFEEALALLPVEDERRRELHVKLGDALAYAGRGRFAARHFETAAMEASPAESLELRRRAADQLLRSGDIDHGLVVARQVLAGVGIRVPETGLGLLASLLFYRTLVLLRGLRFRERDRSQVGTEELTRIDACLTLGNVLATMHPILGFVLSTRGLLRALSAGEVERIVRALGVEATMLATGGERTWPKAKALVDRAAAVAERSGNVNARFLAMWTSGGVRYLSGRFLEATDLLTRTAEFLQDGLGGFVWEQVTTRVFLLRTLTLLGHFKEHQRLQREGLRDAVRRGDTYAAVNMRVGFMNMAYLAADRPDAAESEVRSALKDWTEQGYTVVHYEAHAALATIDLYRGDALAAYGKAVPHLERTRRSLLWRVQIVRVLVHYTLASAGLAMLERGLGDRAAIVRDVTRAARALEREKSTWTAPLATTVRAGLALHRGARDEALRGLDEAARGFDAASMKAYAVAVRDRAARLRNDASSAAAIAAAAAVLRDEDVVAPEKMMATLVPGFSAPRSETA